MIYILLYIKINLDEYIFSEKLSDFTINKIYKLIELFHYY